MKGKILGLAFAAALQGPLWADAVYPSNAVGFDLDTRVFKRLASADETLPVTYSGNEWGQVGGVATVVAGGRHAATLVEGAADDGTVAFVPTDSGYYTLTHTSSAVAGETLCAAFLLEDSGPQTPVAFDLDTRTGTRTVTSAADVLPIAYSGNEWGFGNGVASLTYEYDSVTALIDWATDDGTRRWLPPSAFGPGAYTLRHMSSAAGAETFEAAFYCTFSVDPDSFVGWAAAQNLSGADAEWDAKPAKWGGHWANGFIYKYGEGLADGTLSIMAIGFDAGGKPVITTTPVVSGHDDFTPAVIGAPSLDNWTSPIVLENSGDEWTLPAGESANFFRVQLAE